MSSARYWVAIRPDAGLRRALAGVALLAALAGAAICQSLPLPATARWALSATWIVWSLLQLSRQVRLRQTYTAYRLSERGDLALVGDSVPASPRLLPGTVVTARWGWLLVTDGNGGVWGELVAGNARESETWRRLQVVFRHGRPC